jgi:threonine/homoserine/homoserine lactone efflux protein
MPGSEVIGIVTQACATCTTAPEESRLKGVALFVGAMVFCPCHLPLTAAGFAALLGSAWLADDPALLYVAFGVTYLFFLVFGIRYVFRWRDRERAREAEHARHAPAASSAEAA